MKRILLPLVVLALSFQAGAQTHLNLSKTNALRKLQMAELAIKNIYVDSVNEDKLVEDAIRGMLEKLDPHSAYTTAKETKAMNEPLQGSFEGIGIQFNMAQDTLMVIQPVAGGPSEKAGILAGDRVISVNDSVIAGVKMTTEEIMKRIRGPKNTKVKLGVVRRGIAELLVFDVTRDKIPLHTIDAAYVIRPGVAYIRIGSFGATTHEEFLSAMNRLKAQGARNLILDLQYNGGGYLQAAVNIVEEFLPKNDLIVYTQGRIKERHEYRSRGKGLMSKGKVIVLMNEFSASAAEIVAGALQDQDRAMVIGRRSFGKGLVQTPIQFEDGSMMRLTVAHYYTPSGRCIQKPYTMGNTGEYDMEIDRRWHHGELYSADSIHFADSLKYHTLRKGRVVYGGGGIMPDVFVPLDTMRYTPLHRRISAHNFIVEANLKYIDTNREALKRTYSDFASFASGYKVPAKLIEEILENAAAKGIKAKDEQEKKKTIPMLELQLKALIARDLWDMSEYFSVMNENDDIVKAAVSHMARP